MSTTNEPIIDTHQHLWDLERFWLPWVVPGTPLARSFRLDDYRAAAAGLGIVGTIYMEVDVDPAQHGDEADFVAATCADAGSRMVAGVVGARPLSEGFGDIVDRLSSNPAIQGVRQVLHVAQTPRGFCLDDNFRGRMTLLGAFGLSFDLCMRCDEIADAAELCRCCPMTQFILDHCGNPRVHDPDGETPDRTAWQRDIELLARRPNLVCKVSGLLNTATKGAWDAGDLAPIVNHVLDSFGPERVMFGSDWPVCTPVATLAEWITALREIVAERPTAERRALFHDNAVRVYRLTPCDGRPSA